MLHIRPKLALIAFALILKGVNSPAQKPATAHVAISATDSTGALISGARVKIIPVLENPPSIMETGQDGRLTLDLKLGGYALFVSEPGFKIEVRHIEVRQSAEEQVFPVVLKIGDTGSPIVVSKKEAAKDAVDRARKLFLSAMPYHEDSWIAPEEFKAMPHASVAVTDPTTGKHEDYSGVRLSDLLKSAGVPVGTAGDLYLIAFGDSSSQGQGPALFSLAELQPGLHAGEILIADSKNGRSLGHRLGPFMLVVSADEHRTRWTGQLRELTLQRSQDASSR